jgi:hypothetical protein
MLIPEAPLTKDGMTQSALPSRQGNTPSDDDIQKLCATYADVFSREEKPTPAYIETLTLHLKEDSDFHKRNRRGINKNLKTEFWVIPNIRASLSRIGSRSAQKYLVP